MDVRHSLSSTAGLVAVLVLMTGGSVVAEGATLMPADVRPMPEASWTRADVRLAVAPLPFVPTRDAIIHRRDTTILVDMHGTLLFFDRFLVESRIPALDVALPPGGKLLAARVNDVPVVEPQERGGVVSVQLSGEERDVVEVVSVQEREGLRSRRSQLALDLPQVATPVLVHRLRLLVPGNASYRVRRSDLRAILPSTSVLAKEFDFENPRSDAAFIGPGYLSYGDARLVVKVTDSQGSPLPWAGITLKKGDAAKYALTNALGVAVLNVEGDEYQLEAKREGFSRVEFPRLQLIAGKSLGLDFTLSSGAAETITTQAAPLRPLQAGEFRKEIDQLMERLVVVETPFSMSIPDNGKVLAFSGVLPPQVTVELDVRAKK